eukprot:6479650-Amphidinium_carterae.1
MVVASLLGSSCRIVRGLLRSKWWVATFKGDWGAICYLRRSCVRIYLEYKPTVDPCDKTSGRKEVYTAKTIRRENRPTLKSIRGGVVHNDIKNPKVSARNQRFVLLRLIGLLHGELLYGTAFEQPAQAENYKLQPLQDHPNNKALVTACSLTQGCCQRLGTAGEKRNSDPDCEGEHPGYMMNTTCWGVGGMCFSGKKAAKWKVISHPCYP